MEIEPSVDPAGESDTSDLPELDAERQIGYAATPRGDEEVLRLLEVIAEQNETTAASLRKISKTAGSSDFYLLLLAVVYPILGLIGLFFIFVASS